MPGRDGTGPLGAGPRSGRGMGRCGGGSSVDFRGCGMGRRVGGGSRRMGSGHGWGGQGFADATLHADPAQKRMILEDQVAALEFDLEQARQRLKKLEE